MIKVYYRNSCNSSKQALAWFEKYNIDVEKLKINKITKTELIKTLSLSDKGLKEIVKRSNKANSKAMKQITSLKEMSFNDGITTLLEHPSLLQTPIILEGDKFLVGYNADEIRQFLPPEYRRKALR
ncbi:ArsC/Spx/MgsR family protein [Lactococcus sp. DD01]|uniref:ArsC/Spx/MgsR family protein n=1 Tax=Lactococcus sp. DD01 TaxID=1776443 RepID=UPI000776A005|nr:ArsC/Spx/MgsR family protein [Lactococcus sp. DD01]KXT58994.1 negative regulator of proteolysis [Lactococcus sp. DD01]